jgi:hypothetical protein
MSDDEFLAIVTAGKPSAPDYFGYDAVLNRRRHPSSTAALRPCPSRSPPSSTFGGPGRSCSTPGTR